MRFIQPFIFWAVGVKDLVSHCENIAIFAKNPKYQRWKIAQAGKPIPYNKGAHLVKSSNFALLCILVQLVQKLN